MADDRYRQDHPPHSRPEDRQSQHHSQSHYPPSAESTPRPSDGQRVNSMAASITLPPMQDHRTGGYGPPPHPQGYSYPSDPRYASPNATNGYPPPPGQSGYLPPPQQQSDPRAPSYRPPEHHYQGRPPPSYSHDPHYPPPQDYYYRQQAQGPPPAPSHYPYGPPGGAPLHHYPPEYAQAQAPPMAQAAPRQRTSIACKYCRKRKIRCSGYQSAPGGKCQNCARMNQECVFQPVSSSSSTAFIPVSAVPGGVPPVLLSSVHTASLCRRPITTHPLPPHSSRRATHTREHRYPNMLSNHLTTHRNRVPWPNRLPNHRIHTLREGPTKALRRADDDADHQPHRKRVNSSACRRPDLMLQTKSPGGDRPLSTLIPAALESGASPVCQEQPTKPTPATASD
ncbi:hypothetical protein V2G26_009668 [Clonostachys chloroleuca]